MSSARRRPTQRPRRKKSPVSGRLFAVTALVVVGLVAGLVYLKQPQWFGGHSHTKIAKVDVPSKRKVVKVVRRKPAEPAFEFYKMLPDIEVPVHNHSTSATRTRTARAKFTVQVGAFVSYEKADQRKAELAFIGIEANVRKFKDKHGRLWHRLYLGPFNSFAQAKDELAQLKANHITGVIIRG